MGAVALVVAVAVMGWRVSVWHDSHRKLKATEKALETRSAEAEQCHARERIAQQTWNEAAGKASAQAQADRITAQRIEHDLQDKLLASDARARDLARRLLDATRARASGGAVSAAASASGELAGAGGEPGSDATLGAVFAACERDSARLTAWQEWWRGVSGK